MEFGPIIDNPKLLTDAVKWAHKNRDSIPSLTDLRPRMTVEDLTVLGRSWQNAKLGSMIECSSEGQRSVCFSLNEHAVAVVSDIQKQSVVGRIRAVPRSDWIALGALIISLVALFRPGQ